MKKLLILALICCLFSQIEVVSAERLPGADAIEKASEQTDEANIARQIYEFLSRIYKEDEPGAAVIAVKNGKVIFRKGYGMADMGSGVAIRPEMVFAVGSTTKPFTAMAIMILADRGLLSLDDDISQYLSDYPTRGHKITIRHLLSHTSGIKRLHSIKEYWKHIREDVSLQELVNFFKDEPMEFTPGEKYKYCNSGYYLLGQIIEKVSGQSYEQFMQENIFDPLAMTSTTFANNFYKIPYRVRGYHKEGDRYVNAPDMSFTHLHAAGGLITNVDDLAKWDEALYGEKLISKKQLEHMFSPFILNNGESSHFALGWFLGQLKGTKSIYHGGGIYGFISHTIRLPEKRIYVALLSNCINPKANPPTDHIAESVAAIVMGDPFKEQKRNAIILSPSELKKYAGVYKLITDREAGRVHFIVFMGNRLYFDTGRGHRYEILPESKTTFFVEGKQSILTFKFNENGEVTQMIVHYGGEGGKEIIFKKQ